MASNLSQDGGSYKGPLMHLFPPHSWKEAASTAAGPAEAGAGVTEHEEEGPLPVGVGHPREFASYVNCKEWPAEQFDLVKTLAKAIHGDVLLMMHKPSKDLVVVKKMKNENVERRGPHQLENAENEIGVSCYLTRYTTSEFIVRMIEVFRDASFTYFVTELADKGELFNIVVESKMLDEGRTKYYMAQVLRAVKTLHDNGIVHRDISLENTLLHSDDTVRLVDFGQAVPLFDSKSEKRKDKLLTGRAGKSYYRAPEMYSVAYRGRPVDIFACGVMMFIMALGTPPWQQATLNDDRFAFIQKYSMKPLLEKWNRLHLISPQLLDLMGRMLRVDPATRITLPEVFSHPWFNDPNLAHPPWTPGPPQASSFFTDIPPYAPPPPPPLPPDAAPPPPQPPPQRKNLFPHSRRAQQLFGESSSSASSHHAHRPPMGTGRAGPYGYGPAFGQSIGHTIQMGSRDRFEATGETDAIMGDMHQSMGGHHMGHPGHSMMHHQAHRPVGRMPAAMETDEGQGGAGQERERSGPTPMER